jgi:hypothetical protein
MVFIPLLVAKLVPDFHSELGLQWVTRTRKEELKPFLTNLGTSMRAHFHLIMFLACQQREYHSSSFPMCRT